MADDGTKRKKVSLAAVAEEAGVSISTVSKVANGSADVAETTRARVNEVLRERGYVTPRRRRSTMTSVVLLARSMRSPFTLDVFRGATEAADRLQVDLNVMIYPDTGPDMSWIDELAAVGRKAVVAVTSALTDAERSRFSSLGIVVVVIDPFHAPDEPTFSVGATNWAGGLAATEHLLELGHRRIVMLAGDPAVRASRARSSGHRAAMMAAGIPDDQVSVLDGDFTFESGLASAEVILEGSDRPTAIVAGSDFQALGVLEGARRLGIAVPDELSVTGFDDLIVAVMSSPPLTTVHQPLDEMGRVALETAMALIGGEVDSRIHHVELATTLVVRDSTAPPPSDLPETLAKKESEKL